MTGLFLSVDEYIPDPEVEAVERAIKYLTIGEDYDIFPSRSNIEGWETRHEPHGLTADPANVRLTRLREVVMADSYLNDRHA